MREPSCTSRHTQRHSLTAMPCRQIKELTRRMIIATIGNIVFHVVDGWKATRTIRCWIFVDACFVSFDPLQRSIATEIVVVEIPYKQ